MANIADMLSTSELIASLKERSGVEYTEIGYEECIVDPNGDEIYGPGVVFVIVD